MVAMVFGCIVSEILMFSRVLIFDLTFFKLI